MWVIAKYEKKKLNFFINNLKKNLGEDFVIYNPFMEVKSSPNFFLKSFFKNSKFFLSNLTIIHILFSF